MSRELATVTDIFSKEEIKIDYDSDIFTEGRNSSHEILLQNEITAASCYENLLRKGLYHRGVEDVLSKKINLPLPQFESLLANLVPYEEKKLALSDIDSQKIKDAISKANQKNMSEDKLQSQKEKITSEKKNGVEEMTKDTHIDISKTEFEALLRASKAESESVASGMREEMAKWREEQNTQVASLNSSIAGLIAKIDSKYESMDSKFNSIDTSLTAKMNGMESSLNSKLESIDISLNAKFNSIEQSLNAKIDGVNQALNGKIDGINSAINGVNTSISGIGSKLTLFGIFIAVVLAIAGWFFSSIQSNQSAQPMVIYAQQPVQPQAAPQPPQVIVIPPYSTGDVNVTMPEKTDRHDGLHKNNIKPAQ
ncbi:hypothetical protein ABN238_16715 [Providencia rettgeri]|uniref:hypothetical protein n=1 Tax=Providencia rettgeri TaxID=587 RepID=UPI0032D9E656